MQKEEQTFLKWYPKSVHMNVQWKHKITLDRLKHCDINPIVITVSPINSNSLKMNTTTQEVQYFWDYTQFNRLLFCVYSSLSNFHSNFIFSDLL